MAEKLLTPAAAGEQLGLTIGSLAQMRYLGTGPLYLKLSPRAIRYRQADIDEWVVSKARLQT